MRLSKAFTLVETTTMGRSVVTNRPVPAGSVVLTAQSTGCAAVLLDSVVAAGRHCSICLTSRPNLVPCNVFNCRASLCVECQANTTHRLIHSFECGPTSQESELVRSLVRLMLCEKTSNGSTSTTPSDPSNPSTPPPTHPIPPQKIQSFHNVSDLTLLEDHLAVFDQGRKEAFGDAALRALQLANMNCLPEAIERWTRVAAAFESNEFGISGVNQWVGESALSLGSESVGNGLFVHGAYVNHSCNPNSHFVVHCKPGALPTLVIRTTRSLNTDQHVFISYTSLYTTMEQRKNSLYDMYRFECQCERCTSVVSDEEGMPHLINAAMTGLLCTSSTCGMGLLENIEEDIEGSDEQETSATASQGPQWCCTECLTMQTITQHMKSHERLGLAVSELQMAVVHNCQGEECRTQVEELKAAQAQAAVHLHSFHTLHHAARVMLVGMAWLNTNGQDVKQISNRASIALEPLKRSQTMQEYMLWISILETLVLVPESTQDPSSSLENMKHSIKVLQCHYGKEMGTSFMNKNNTMLLQGRPGNKHAHDAPLRKRPRKRQKRGKKAWRK